MPFRPTDISLDGVSECRSNTNSIDVYSLRFQQCQTIYPHTLVRPLQKYKVDNREYLEKFIRDLTIHDCLIKLFVGDNPKRAFVKYVLQHSSLYACDYCTVRASSHSINSDEIECKKKEIEVQRGIIQRRLDQLIEKQEGGEEQEKEEEEAEGNQVQEEISTLQAILSGLNQSLKEVGRKKTQTVWPSSTLEGGEPRTKESIAEIANRLEQEEDVSYDEAKGVIGKSPLLTLERFDIVLDSPAEYLHSVCLGVGKRLIELTFNVGINRPRVTKRKLTPVKMFNDLMRYIKVTCEFSRRVRALDFSVMKGQEFRNIILFFFPIIVTCLGKHHKEKKIWLLFSYMIRACVIPTKEFQNLNESQIEECGKQFYKLYEQVYGERNCTYNTHIVSSHIMQIRVHGPLTFASAFAFENFYGEMRKAFVPGTVSPLKQIFEKILIKRSLSYHICEPNILLTNYETSLEANNFIYTYRLGFYKFYKIIDVEEDKIKCVQIQTSIHKFPETPTLKWEKVGVFKEEETLTEEVSIEHSLVAGKVLRIQNLLITCPKNVLCEK